MHPCREVIGVDDEAPGERVTSRARGMVVMVLAFLLATVAPGFAQSSTPAASNTSAAAASPQRQPAATATGVEEIVVTAQKREQLSEQVPIALTALTASSIQFRGIDDLTDLEMQVPGLQFGQDTGADRQVYIRGIGIDDASGSVESPIATYINGVYQTRTFWPSSTPIQNL